MVIALFDRSVGTDNSLALWHALGEPDAMFVPLGHYTTFLELPYLKFRAMQFFHEKLGGPPLAGNLGFIYTKPTTKTATEIPTAPAR